MFDSPEINQPRDEDGPAQVHDRQHYELVSFRRADTDQNYRRFFAVNSLAINHGRPETLGLKAIITCYIEHRREVVMRRTRFELRKAEDRAETLEGYLIALANMDEFIRIIRGSANREEARIKRLPRTAKLALL